MTKSIIIQADPLPTLLYDLLIVYEQFTKRDRISEEILTGKGFDRPKAGIVLGTGLEGFVQHLDTKSSIPYTEIPYFSEVTVEFHKGRLLSMMCR